MKNNKLIAWVRNNPKWAASYAVKILIVVAIIVAGDTSELADVFLLLIIISPVLAIAVVLVVLVLLAEFPLRFRFTKNFFTKHILNPLIILAGTTAVIGIMIGLDTCKSMLITERIKFYSKNSETTFVLQSSVTYPAGGIRSTGVESPSLFVDYDSHTAAFLLGSFDSDFKVFHLKDDAPMPSGVVQCEIPMNSPGKALISYCPDDKAYYHSTTGLVLVMEDGTEYRCTVKTKKRDYDYLSLNKTKE